MEKVSNIKLHLSADAERLAPGLQLEGVVQKPKAGPTSQGESDGPNNALASSFRSGSEGVALARMSSGEFDRESDDNDLAASFGRDSRERAKPVLATPENIRCYSRFENHPVRMEGPEFSQDYTYYLVDKMPDLKKFEQGIPLNQFKNSMN